MARRSPSSKSHASGQRALSQISANPRLLLRPISVSLSPSRIDLRIFEDRRTWHPVRFARPVVSVGPRSDTRLMVKPAKTFSPAVTFANPKRVLVCVRRKVRKEVLHAFGKTGGGSSRRPKRRNQFSDVSC